MKKTLSSTSLVTLILILAVFASFLSVHSQKNHGRPMISSNGHLTGRISVIVDYHLKPLGKIAKLFDTTSVLSSKKHAQSKPAKDKNGVVLTRTDNQLNRRKEHF